MFTTARTLLVECILKKNIESNGKDKASLSAVSLSRTQVLELSSQYTSFTADNSSFFTLIIHQYTNTKTPRKHQDNRANAKSPYHLRMQGF